MHQILLSISLIHFFFFCHYLPLSAAKIFFASSFIVGLNLPNRCRCTNNSHTNTSTIYTHKCVLYSYASLPLDWLSNSKSMVFNGMESYFDCIHVHYAYVYMRRFITQIREHTTQI